MNIARIVSGALALGFLAAPAAFAQTYSALPPESQSRFDAWYRHFDANGDGVIAHDEYMQAQEARFRAADTDADGKLSKDEVLVYLSREGGGGQSGGSAPAQ